MTWLPFKGQSTELKPPSGGFFMGAYVARHIDPVRVKPSCARQLLC